MTIPTYEASMLLTSSLWANKPSFRLMPLTEECLFVEGIYDTESKVLVMISKVQKDTFHMVPKLDDNGDVLVSKAPRANGSRYKEERRQLETFQEYYITEKNEIDEFIKMVAVNSDKYDYSQYLNKSNIIVEQKPEIILPNQ